METRDTSEPALAYRTTREVTAPMSSRGGSRNRSPSFRGLEPRLSNLLSPAEPSNSEPSRRPAPLAIRSRTPPRSAQNNLRQIRSSLSPQPEDQATRNRSPRQSIPSGLQQRRAIPAQPNPVHLPQPRQWGQFLDRRAAAANIESLQGVRDRMQDQSWNPSLGWDYSTGLPRYSLGVWTRNHYTAISGPRGKYFKDLDQQLPDGLRVDFQRVGEDYSVLWLERRPVLSLPSRDLASINQAAARIIAILHIWSRDLNRNFNHDLQPISEWYQDYLDNPQRYWGL